MARRGIGDQVPVAGVERVGRAALAPEQRRPAAGLDHVHRADAITGSLAAIRVRVSTSSGGSGRVLGCAARRSTCRARLGRKQYLEGTWGSTTARKEDAPSLLGEPEVLRVKDRPCHAVPEGSQLLEDRLEVAALMAVEQPGDVLEQKPARA